MQPTFLRMTWADTSYSGTTCSSPVPSLGVKSISKARTSFSLPDSIHRSSLAAPSSAMIPTNAQLSLRVGLTSQTLRFVVKPSFPMHSFSARPSFMGQNSQRMSFSILRDSTAKPRSMGRVFDRASFFRIGNKGQHVVFLKKADFSHARFGLQADFARAEFVEDASFGEAHFFANAGFEGANFHQVANFERVTIDGVATFRTDDQGISARFDEDANFGGSTMGRASWFQGARFAGRAIFNNSRFLGEVSFADDLAGRPTIFSSDAQFEATMFERPASFNSARFIEERDSRSRHFGAPPISATANRRQVHPFPSSSNLSAPYSKGTQVSRTRTSAISTNFEDARFTRGATFVGADFQGLTFFVGIEVLGMAAFHRSRQRGPVIFQDFVSFQSSRFDGSAKFQQAYFNADVDFSGVIFGRDAWWQDARFAGPANFRAIVVRGEANFQDARFLAPIDFREAKLGLVLFQLGADDHRTDFDPTDGATSGSQPQRSSKSRIQPPRARGNFDSDVDLRGMKYERIDVPWADLLVRQNPYSRQPYAQLESTLRAIGDDETADRVYVSQRRREARNRLARHELRDVPGCFSDIALRWLTGYGVNLWQLVAFILALLAFGTWVYLLPGAAVLSDPSLASNLAPGIDWVQAFELSLDQTLPFDIDSGKSWRPSDQVVWEVGAIKIRFAEFGTFQSILGLVVIPIGVTAVASRLWKKQKSIGI